MRMKTFAAAAVLGVMAGLASAFGVGAQPGAGKATEPAAAKAPAKALTAAERAYERLKALAGKWGSKSDKGWEHVTEFAVIAGGSCVMETLRMGNHGGQTMVTMYHMDQGRLMLTHYCAARNQPRMVASDIAADGAKVRFEFKDATGIPSRDAGHMDKAEIEFTNDETFHARWTWYQDGKEQWMEKIVFQRIKSDAQGDDAAAKSSAKVADQPSAGTDKQPAKPQGVSNMASPLGYDGGLTCGIQVTNLDKAIKWYGDNLGFTMLYKVDDLGWAEMATEIKGVNIGLSQVEKITGTGNCKLTFGVHDIDKTRKMLEAKGVKFTGETITIPGMVKLATFEDLDKNVAMFFQDLQKK